MIRKAQILIELFRLFAHALTAPLVGALWAFGYGLTLPAQTYIFFFFAYPLARAVFGEYQFIKKPLPLTAQLFREAAYATIASLPLISHYGFWQSANFILALTLVSLPLQAILRAVEKQFYLHFPAAKIRILFAGPSHIAKRIVDEIAARGIKYIFQPIGYVDYKSVGDALPFMGKFVDLDSVLSKERPQVLINCGRIEQHVSLNYAASVHGISYFSVPQNIQWNDISLHQTGPFQLPLIEYSNARLSYWAYATKRILDLILSICLIAIFAPFFAIKSLRRRAPLTHKTTNDPRHGRQFTFRHIEHPGNELSTWKDYPMLLNVLKNDMSLIGPHPYAPSPTHHYDLKFGIFPPLSAHSTTAANTTDLSIEENLLRYRNNWQLHKELTTVAYGAWNMLKTFLA